MDRVGLCGAYGGVDCYLCFGPWASFIGGWMGWFGGGGDEGISLCIYDLNLDIVTCV